LILPEAGKSAIARRKPFRLRLRGWVTARKFTQTIAFLVFLALFFGFRTWGWDANIANLALKLDPLTMAAYTIASRTLQASALLGLIVIVLTLVFGRAWCGWLCPLGSILDLFSLKRIRGKRNPPPESWRKIKYFLLFTLLFAAILGNLTLMVLDPLTIVYRTLTVSVLPAVDQTVTAVEKVLYPLPAFSEPVSNIDAWLRQNMLPQMPLHYEGAIITILFFAGVIALNLFARRFWCRYICPLGGLLGLLSKFAIFKRVVKTDCKGCNVCTRECPTGTIDPEKDYASDPGECTVCMECVVSCPGRSAVFTPSISKAKWNTYDPGRREALAAFGLAAASLAVMRVEPIFPKTPSFLIRPPGVTEEKFLATCVRCGECMRACPTGVLQPAITQAGLEGLWTPVLTTRLGYCDFSCTACGQICPTQAIPRLSLEEKRKQIIGKAYINQNRCIPWSNHTDCIVCEEMCPVSPKAIELKPTEFTRADGSVALVRLPEVLRDLCIGCGICEYKCPPNGEAAIRVYVPGTRANF
jgi:polyferredoxin